MKRIIGWLKEKNACADGLKYAVDADSVDDWWNNCDRGEWLLWVAGKLAGEPGCEKRKKLVLCSCKCARLALPYVKEGEKRPLIAIETAERWANGDKTVTLADVKKAANAAYAACAADAADAAYAACAVDAASAA